MMSSKPLDPNSPTARLDLCVPRALKERLQQAARADDSTVSIVVRELVEKWLAKKGR